MRVVDLSTFLSGPFCTQILADLGAEVIKVEAPTGDSTRTIPPHFHHSESAYYLSVNRSKRSIVLDLTTEAGREVLHGLVAVSDVVVDNYRPGTAARLGAGYAELQAVNERVVVCSISGFGQDGPYARRPAYDMIVQAMSGGMSMTGEVGGRPVRSGIPIGDLCAGQMAALAIAAALVERTKSGRGQHIDISMLDVQVSMLSYQAAYHLMSGEEPGPQGRGHASIPTYTSFIAKDGRDVLICANTERMWLNMCAALGLDELAVDPRFASGDLRFANREALRPLLEAAFAARDSEELYTLLVAHEVPCARVNRVGEALSDPQVIQRGMVRTVPHTLGGEIRVVGNPIMFSRSATAEFRSPPTLGQHTHEVLTELLSYAQFTIDDLAARGAFGRGEMKR